MTLSALRALARRAGAWCWPRARRAAPSCWQTRRPALRGASRRRGGGGAGGPAPGRAHPSRPLRRTAGPRQGRRRGRGLPRRAGAGRRHGGAAGRRRSSRSRGTAADAVRLLGLLSGRTPHGDLGPGPGRWPPSAWALAVHERTEVDFLPLSPQWHRGLRRHRRAHGQGRGLRHPGLRRADGRRGRRLLLQRDGPAPGAAGDPAAPGARRPGSRHEPTALPLSGGGLGRGPGGADRPDPPARRDWSGAAAPTCPHCAVAIRELAVRGAPAIGVAAAYGLALSWRLARAAGSGPAALLERLRSRSRGAGGDPPHGRQPVLGPGAGRWPGPPPGRRRRRRRGRRRRPAGRGGSGARRGHRHVPGHGRGRRGPAAGLRHRADPLQRRRPGHRRLRHRPGRGLRRARRRHAACASTPTRPVRCCRAHA